MIMPPCKDCADRTIEPNCHDTCKCFRLYKEAKAKERAEHTREMYDARERESRARGAMRRPKRRHE